MSINNRYTGLADSTDPEPIIPLAPLSSIPTPALPLPLPQQQKASSEQGNKAAPIEHDTATDPCPSPRGLTQQHTKATSSTPVSLSTPPYAKIRSALKPQHTSAGGLHYEVGGRGQDVDWCCACQEPGSTGPDLCEWLASCLHHHTSSMSLSTLASTAAGEGLVSVASRCRLVSLHRRAFFQVVLQASSILPLPLASTP